ncbi:MAG: hypothetical protein AABX83_03340 [Nanoarchaeota archaeon]
MDGQDNFEIDINCPKIPDETGWSLKEIERKIRYPPLDVRVEECLGGGWISIEGRTESDVKPYLDEYLDRGYRVLFRDNDYCGLGFIQVSLIKNENRNA